MLQKKNKILRHFYELLSKPDKMEKSEVLLAAFCLHSSRCFVQINKFLQEYKSIKPIKHFLINGKDVSKELRDDIIKIKTEYQSKFKNVVPIMDQMGNLIFDEKQQKESLEQEQLEHSSMHSSMKRLN